MRWLTQRPLKAQVFWGMMAASVVSLVWLPPSWSDGLKNLTQLLVPFQSPAYGLTRAAVGRMQRLQSASQDPADATADQRTLLENQIVGLCSQLEQIRIENSRLRGLRDRYVPPAVRIVPARVVARDISTWRDSLLLSRGRASGVQRQDPVTSQMFVSRGSLEGVGLQHKVLASEFLIGEIEHVGPLMARVRLFTDVGVRTEVRVGRIVNGRFQPVQYPCTMLGHGRGEMTIDDVPQRFVADVAGNGGADTIHVGDLVVSVTQPPDLPTAMVIGRVASFENDPRKRLLTTIHVQPGVSADQVDDVFVVATGESR